MCGQKCYHLKVLGLLSITEALSKFPKLLLPTQLLE